MLTKEQVEKIMFDVAEDTLEKLAFMFISLEDGRDDSDYDSVVAASVSFAGPLTGTVVLMVSTQLIPELSANMLGVEEEETTQDQRNDALKETINVICGNLLPAIGGKQAVFDMGAPRIIAESESIKQAMENTHGYESTSIARMAIDDEQCDLFLFVDGEISGERDG